MTGMKTPSELQPTPGEALTQRPIPELNPDQLAEYRLDTLHIDHKGEFDPQAMLDLLAASDGQELLAVDIGGDKISVSDFRVAAGRLHPSNGSWSEPTAHGRGYIDILQQASARATERGIPVGISFAGPVEEMAPLGGANVRELMHDLEEYGGTFRGHDKELFGDRLKVLANDAVAGLYFATVEALRQNPDATNVIYLINGSGVGGAVWKDGQVIATEVGHPDIVPAMNPYSQTEPCGLFDKQSVCVERVAAGKAGIESAWKRQTGQPLGGRDIAERARDGDKLALNLYDLSAELTATSIIGLAQSLDIPLSQHTVIVGHGGVFKFEQFRHRIIQILAANQSSSEVLVTYDFSDNACLDGAALAALAENAVQASDDIAAIEL